MKIQVLLFAGLAERAGCRRMDWTLAESPASLKGTLEDLAERFPFLENYPYALAVNGEYADSESTLIDGDELALIPPVSGG